VLINRQIRGLLDPLGQLETASRRRTQRRRAGGWVAAGTSSSRVHQSIWGAWWGIGSRGVDEAKKVFEGPHGTPHSIRCASGLHRYLQSVLHAFVGRS